MALLLHTRETRGTQNGILVRKPTTPAQRRARCLRRAPARPLAPSPRERHRQGCARPRAGPPRGACRGRQGGARWPGRASAARGADLDGRRVRHDALRPRQRVPQGPCPRHAPHRRRQRRRVHPTLQGRTTADERRGAARDGAGVQVCGRGGAQGALHHVARVPALGDRDLPHRLRRPRRRPVHRRRQRRLRVGARAGQVPHHPAHRGRLDDRDRGADAAPHSGPPPRRRTFAGRAGGGRAGEGG
mmetsp:Transcript_21613/g.64620  ORF Transcript_21613/g.64620 Transcript_21613/m.64620 type:complete len:245 (-) Transcript_21613:9-743(-)